MTTSRNLDAVLKSAAQPGTIVVTSNTRAARNLKRAYADLQLASGHSVWTSPEILPWSAWTKRLWHEHIFRSPREFTALLDDRQEQMLWEKIIAGDRRNLDAGALASQCTRAWRLIHSFRIPRDRATYQRKPDARAFFSWSSAYLAECQKNGWLDEARLLDHLHATASESLRNNSIVFWGFDSFTPQQQAFLDSLKSSGLDCQFLQPDGNPAEPVRIGLDDTVAELRAAALWSRALLQRSPKATVGIVIPNLDDVRAVAERIFLEVLHPAGLTITGTDIRRSFEISLGVSLKRVPIIGAAFALLNLAARQQNLEIVSRILRSPFVGREAESDARAMLDVYIRTKGVTELSLESVQNFANDRPGCTAFAKSLRDFGRSVAKLSGKLPPSRWSREILPLLDSAGWPGTRTETSFEHQARRSLADLLSSFAKLDLVAEPMDFASMVRRLSMLAADAIFQPENLGAPIQLVGILEAAGSQFDHLWVMGMHAASWPPDANPSPFIPIDLQRAHDSTGASTSERLQYAQSVTQRLLRSSPDIVVSYPYRDKDVDLEPSPIFAPFDRLDPSKVPISNAESYQRVLFASSGNESQVDKVAPIVDAPISSGGTKIFELQAACPFRAFAELRLDARELEMPAPGLDLRLRGRLLHRSLELVWEELQSSLDLKSKPQEELEGIIQRNVDRAMNEADTALLTGWEHEVAQLERDRLLELVAELLGEEKKRLAPFRVRDRELKTEITHGGITAKVKVDRIDELENGSLVLLDYKSGKPMVGRWNGERPDSPQLPIYASKLRTQLAAVAFVQLNREKIQFKGYSKSDNILPGVKRYDALTEKQRPAPTFDELLSNWNTNLEKLGAEFRRGVSDVDPKTRVTCDQCHLHMLCRINEAPLAPDEEAADD